MRGNSALSMWKIIGTIRPFWAWILLVVSAGILSVVWIMQYGFGLLPCDLCLWQRWPYYGLGVLALIVIIVRQWQKEDKKQKFFSISAGILATILATGGMFLALYHVGIEEYWWQRWYPSIVSECAATQSTTTMNIEELREYFMSRTSVTPSCAQVSWSLFGLSLASYNGLFSVALMIYCILITCSFFGIRRNNDEYK